MPARSGRPSTPAQRSRARIEWLGQERSDDGDDVIERVPRGREVRDGQPDHVDASVGRRQRVEFQVED